MNLFKFRRNTFLSSNHIKPTKIASFRLIVRAKNVLNENAVHSWCSLRKYYKASSWEVKATLTCKYVVIGQWYTSFKIFSPYFNNLIKMKTLRNNWENKINKYFWSIPLWRTLLRQCTIGFVKTFTLNIQFWYHFIQRNVCSFKLRSLL